MCSSSIISRTRQGCNQLFATNQVQNPARRILKVSASARILPCTASGLQRPSHPYFVSQSSASLPSRGCEALMQHQHVVWRGCRPRTFAAPQHLQQSRPAQQQLQQQRHYRLICYASSSVGAEEAKRLIEREGYKILDVRSARDYDDKHITKPARCSISAPVVMNDNVTPNARFLAEVAGQASKATKLLVMCADGGALSDAALQQLAEADYSAAVRLKGGYAGWSEVWSPSGKRRPPPGRWVSTGKEALKSGLNIPGVAESYDEGGNLTTARWARGLKEGEQLPPSSW